MTSETVIKAAESLSVHASDLARALLDGGQSLHQVGDAHAVVGHLVSALSRLVSAMRELDEWAMSTADSDPTLRHDHGTRHEAAAALINSGLHFETAARAVGEAAEELCQAHAALGPVGHDTQGVDQ